MSSISTGGKRISPEDQRERVLVVRPFAATVKALRLAGMQVTTLGVADTSWRVENEECLAQNAIPSQHQSLHSPAAGLIGSVLEIASILREKQIQIIHVNALKSLLQAFLAVRLLIPRRSRPTIVTMSHNPLVWQQPRTTRLAFRMIQHLSDGFVALASSHREQLKSMGLTENRVIMIPNPYDRDWLRESSLHSPGPSAKRRIRLIYPATICSRKAQHLLVQAAALVIKKNAQVEFVLAGEEGPEPEYARQVLSLVNELGIHEHIALTGLVPHLQVAETLAGCDIVVFPSLAEMMPRAVIEGMIIGKPVVASAVGGIPDLIRHRETGLLVQPGDVNGLAAALCELVEDDELASRLASAGRDFALEFCAPERVGKLFREFFAQLGQELAR